MDKLMDNPYAWGILALCTIFSVAFGVWAYVKSKRKKEISYYKNSYEVVRAGKSLIPDLELRYNNHEIKELVITRYAIWNSGNEVLNGSDIVTSMPLQILSRNKDSKILDVKIIQRSDIANDFRVRDVNSERASIEFEYANVNDGIVVQVIHTGEAKDIGVDGKIKGGKQLKSLKKERKTVNSKKETKFITILTGILVGIVAIMMTVMLVGSISKGVAIGGIIIVVAVCGIFMAVLIWTYIGMLKAIYHIDIPSSIREAIGYDEFYM